jgi:uncharacterized protein with GYD domain
LFSEGAHLTHGKEGRTMPTYITLANYTQHGITNMKESPSRLAAAREAMAAAGVELKAFYLTLGRFDAVVIVEAPDSVTAAKVLITIGMQGSISTETLQAFTEDEYREIIAALP